MASSPCHLHPPHHQCPSPPGDTKHNMFISTYVFISVYMFISVCGCRSKLHINILNKETSKSSLRILTTSLLVSGIVQRLPADSLGSWRPGTGHTWRWWCGSDCSHRATSGPSHSDPSSHRQAAVPESSPLLPALHSLPLVTL